MKGPFLDIEHILLRRLFGKNNLSHNNRQMDIEGLIQQDQVGILANFQATFLR